MSEEDSWGLSHDNIHDNIHENIGRSRPAKVVRSHTWSSLQRSYKALEDGIGDSLKLTVPNKLKAEAEQLYEEALEKLEFAYVLMETTWTHREVFRKLAEND